jgi:hypothetical protein
MSLRSSSVPPSHQWEIGRQHMTIEEDNATANLYGNLPFIVDPLEAERLVENLKMFNIEEIGSSAYMIQHEIFEKLNLQAHQSAMTNSDEYILESILTYSKLEIIFHELLIIEIWKELIYPHLLDHIAGRNNMRVYFILYHEATLVNLLEILLYHKHVCESCGEKMIELVDYCARKLARLNGGYDFGNIDPVSSFSSGETSMKELTEAIDRRTAKDELAQHLTEIEFRVCISSCAIARMICEHSDSLPLSVVSRISDTHDFLG